MPLVVAGGAAEAKDGAAEVDEDEDEDMVEVMRRCSAKLSSIDKDRDERIEQATRLEEYLHHQAEEAGVDDEKERISILKQGLLLKAELPRGESHLVYDIDTLAGSFGSFGSHLIIARRLLLEHEDMMTKRRGNDPNATVKDTTVRTVAGYLQSTSAQRIRMEERPRTRLELVTLKEHQKRADGLLPPLEDAEQDPDEEGDERTVQFEDKGGAEGTQDKPGKAPSGKSWLATMSAAEREVNDKILVRMDRKLNFLRNPRHATKNRDCGFDTVGLADTMGDPDKAAEQPCVPEPGMVFVAQPEGVLFSEYSVGGVYEQSLTLRNVSDVSRRIRVLPPATEHFSMSLLQYPSGDGMVAPGMSCQVAIRFAPDSLADYSDCIIAITEQNKFKVKVEARRPPPSLTIPLELDCGSKLVGTNSVTTFKCANYGGPGRFKLLPEDEWPHPRADALQREAVNLPPFQISPTEFELENSASVDIQVRFEPEGVGVETRRFVMVCDNCQVRSTGEPTYTIESNNDVQVVVAW